MTKPPTLMCAPKARRSIFSECNSSTGSGTGYTEHQERSAGSVQLSVCVPRRHEWAAPWQ